MGKPTGFKEFDREAPQELPPEQRVQNFKEFLVQLPSDKLGEQGARCMDCGIPFCHAGCPLGNLIPDWNDLVYKKDWQQAISFLHETNNFPEFTGRVCPAPCEESCVLALTEPAVTIKNIELSIVEKAFVENWIVANPPTSRSGLKVAVVGSGPAGLACAQQLNSVGHLVTVFERSDRLGGLLMYGIPDFKLEKHVIDRRMALLEEEGIVFRTGVNVGVDITGEQLQEQFDAVVLCCGATEPRDIEIPGRELSGIHFAMDFLAQQNRRVAGDEKPFIEDGWWFSKHREDILATDKHVIILGGGDTGSDCVGTSNRHNAASVTQFQYKPAPPDARPEDQPWPYWPLILRESSSHKEGCDRRWSVLTKEFCGKDGKVTHLKTVEVEWQDIDGRPQLQEVPNTEKEWPADLVLLAIGFVGCETLDLVPQLKLSYSPNRVIPTDQQYATSTPGVFCCGDMKRGQSLVVWAISEGREAARAVDTYLTGLLRLREKGDGDLPIVRY